MKRLKVLTVVGTRPEIIRLARVLYKLDSSPVIEHILVHTGQNYDYELNQIFFEDLSLKKPDYFLNAAGKNATETAGNILVTIDPVLEKEQPDAFLVLGDTNSCLCAIAAKKRHIPIFHMEAGNRCFDQRVPEETNRKIQSIKAWVQAGGSSGNSKAQSSCSASTINRSSAAAIAGALRGSSIHS